MKPHATHFNSVYIHNQNQSTGFKNNKQGILLNRAPEFEQENQFNKWAWETRLPSVLKEVQDYTTDSD